MDRVNLWLLLLIILPAVWGAPGDDADNADTGGTATRGNRESLDLNAHYEMQVETDTANGLCFNNIRIKGKEGTKTKLVDDIIRSPCLEVQRRTGFPDDVIIFGSVNQDLLVYGQLDTPDWLVVIQFGRCRIDVHTESGKQTNVLDKDNCDQVKELMKALEKEFDKPSSQASPDVQKEYRKQLQDLLWAFKNSFEDVEGSFNGDVYSPLEKKRYQGKSYELKYKSKTVDGKCVDVIRIHGKKGVDTEIVDETFNLPCEQGRMKYIADDLVLVGAESHGFLVYGQKHIPDRLIVVMDGKCRVNTFTDRGMYTYYVGDVLGVKIYLENLQAQFKVEASKRDQDVLKLNYELLTRFLTTVPIGEEASQKENGVAARKSDIAKNRNWFIRFLIMFKNLLAMLISGPIKRGGS